MLPLLLCHWCLPLPPSQLAGATGVVSCVGAFGSNEQMEKICGDATVTATEAAKKVLNELTNCAAYCVNTPGPRLRGQQVVTLVELIRCCYRSCSPAHPSTSVQTVVDLPFRTFFPAVVKKT